MIKDIDMTYIMYSTIRRCSKRDIILINITVIKILQNNHGIVRIVICKLPVKYFRHGNFPRYFETMLCCNYASITSTYTCEAEAYTIVYLKLTLLSTWSIHYCLPGACTDVYLEPALLSTWSLHSCLPGACTLVYLEPALLFTWSLHCSLPGPCTAIYTWSLHCCLHGACTIQSTWSLHCCLPVACTTVYLDAVLLYYMHWCQAVACTAVVSSPY